MKKNIILLLLLTYLFPAFAQDSRQDKAMTHYNWGNEFSGSSEYRLAILEYNGTIALMPNFYRAYYRRGNAYYMSGNNRRALDDYNTAIKLSPDYAEAYFNRGILFFNTGVSTKSIDDIKKSISDWEAVLRIEPNHAQAKEYLERARRLLARLQPTPPAPEHANRPVSPSAPRSTSITIFTYSDNNENTRVEFDELHSTLKIITDFPDRVK